VANKLAQGISQNMFTTTDDMLGEAGKTPSDFLKILLEPSYSAGANPASEHLRKKRKKRLKGQQITR
jgi:hypothetical protein